MLKNRYKTLLLAAVLVFTLSSCGNSPKPASVSSQDTSFAAKENNEPQQTTTSAADDTTEASEPEKAQKDPADPKQAAQEYWDKIKEKLHSYTEETNAMTEAMGNDMTNLDVDAIASANERMIQILIEMKEITPSAEFVTQHEKLCASIDNEIEFDKKLGRYMEIAVKGENMTEDDIAEFNGLNDYIENNPSDFTDVLVEIVKELKSFIEN